MHRTIPIFIGYDPLERVAANVLADSLVYHSTLPLSITMLVKNQLIDNFNRSTDKYQSTEFSFTRFLVPWLMNYRGWAIFMDCDMLCRQNIVNLWKEKDEKFAIMCVKHNHEPSESYKFLGGLQSRYAKKNWSSLMLMNCHLCHALTPEYIEHVSGLDLHQFKWLDSEGLVGDLPLSQWNHLIDVQEKSLLAENGLPHWTLGGPWLKDYRTSGGDSADEWFRARDDAFGI